MNRSIFACNTGLKFHCLRLLAAFTRTHGLPGIDRLLRCLYHPGHRTHDHLSVTLEYDDRLLIQINTSSYIEWSLFFYGHYEPEVTQLIKRLCRPGSFAVDVGANVGCHALVMASILEGTPGRVLAFEPHPWLYARLMENIALNRLRNIDAYQLALSDAPCRSPLYCFEDSNENQGVSSLYGRNVGKGQKSVEVDVTALDQVVEARAVPRVDLIKIDTEGAEVPVLRGAANCIRLHRPHIIFEYDPRTWTNAGYNFSHARSLLAEFRYGMHEIRRGYLLRIEEDTFRPTNILASPILA